MCTDLASWVRASPFNESFMSNYIILLVLLMVLKRKVFIAYLANLCAAYLVLDGFFRRLLPFFLLEHALDCLRRFW